MREHAGSIKNPPPGRVAQQSGDELVVSIKQRLWQLAASGQVLVCIVWDRGLVSRRAGVRHDDAASRGVQPPDIRCVDCCYVRVTELAT